ncbi:MAG: sigma-70 family RNA polymerase sigma factor [Thermoguttaceae bacterium]|nr:sigma-70 family RNA polymerase sigma factor [Thermoguttaceae bacterium]
MTSSSSQPPDDFDEDARLMLSVQADDPLAFEQLMQRNQSRVAAFLLRLVGNQQLAEDLTQEVFMRVYQHRATYRQEARFTTWLYRVAHNVAYNALRAKSRRPEALFSGVSKRYPGETTGLGFEESVMAQTNATPTRQIAKVELQQIVRDAVEKLPPRQREAIVLSRFNGMSYQEIADVMNMTPQAVKSLLCRARLNLKEALTPYVEDGRTPS